MQGGQNYHQSPLSPPAHQQQQQQYHNGGYSNQPSYPQTQYQSYQQPQSQSQSYPHPQQQQYQQQPPSNYQRQISHQSQYPSAQRFTNPDPTFLRQTTPQYLQPGSQERGKSPSCTTAFSGGISVGAKPPVANPYSNPLDNFEVSVPPHGRGANARGWSHVNKPTPVQSGYVQPQYNQRPLQQQQYVQSNPDKQSVLVTNTYTYQVRTHFCSFTLT